MKCKNCGKKNDEGSEFCKYCGTSLKEEVVQNDNIKSNNAEKYSTLS